MPTTEERIRQVTLKIDRAKVHKAELDREMKAFISTRPVKVGLKKNPQTNKFNYYIKNVAPIPDCIPLIVGDVIQNLMTALDHLAYQIICKDTGQDPPSNKDKIYFPIADDEKSYQKKKSRTMIGAKPKTFNALDELKPYKGGNDLFWILWKLNNIEKHRLLLTVGGQLHSMNMAQVFAQLNSGKNSEFETIPNSLKIYIKPKDKGFPLKKGDVIYTSSVGEEPHPNQEFVMDIAVNEAPIIEHASVSGTLYKLGEHVESIITQLTPYLK